LEVYVHRKKSVDISLTLCRKIVKILLQMTNTNLTYVTKMNY